MAVGDEEQPEHRGDRPEPDLREADQPVGAVDEDEPERDQRVEGADHHPVGEDPDRDAGRHRHARDVADPAAAEEQLVGGDERRRGDGDAHRRAHRRGQTAPPPEHVHTPGGRFGSPGGHSPVLYRSPPLSWTYAPGLLSNSEVAAASQYTSRASLSQVYLPGAKWR